MKPQNNKRDKNNEVTQLSFDSAVEYASEILKSEPHDDIS